jgi:hypothetical protein
MTDEYQYVSRILPESARAKLIRAAATPIEEDPLARRKAIEEATRIIRQQFPSYFKKR